MNLNLIFQSANPDLELEPDWDYHNPMAGYYLESFLKIRGYEAHCVFNWNDDLELTRAMRSDPIVVCFSTTYVINNLTLESALKALRRVVGSTPIIVGGPYIWSQHLQYVASSNLVPPFWQSNAKHGADGRQEDALREFGVDPLKDFLFKSAASGTIRDAVYVASEFGEFTLLRLLEAFEQDGGSSRSVGLEHIPNLVLSQPDGSWIRTRQEPEPVDLNLHFTRWDQVDRVESDWLPIRTSIGCPYRCRYCDFIELHPKVMMRSPESLLTEFKIAQQRGVSDFYFIDDNIFLTKARLNELAESILRLDAEVTWGGHFRVDRIDESNIDLIARSGARLGQCGIESFDQGQLIRMRKGCKRENSIRGIDLCSSRGMSLFLNLIIGYPGETKETLESTINALNALDMSQSGFPSLEIFPLVVIPNTELDRPDYRRQYDLRGRFGGWTHNTMSASEVDTTWAPYLFRNSTPTSAHGKDQVPDGWNISRRNQALQARKQLVLAFADRDSDHGVQARFENLYRCFMTEPDAVPPEWTTVIAPRERQPNGRTALPSMMYGVENTLSFEVT
jgi:radical SAM superfamily enzyme YgiQ (UPF0313 family)